MVMYVDFWRALEDCRRRRLFAQADEAYQALRADPVAWAQELEERAAWDCTLMHGIEAEGGDTLSKHI